MPVEIGLCNVYGNRYRIYVLKSMPERFYSAKFLKSQISITQLIILSRKTQCNCVLIKVLLDFFQKIAGCGTESHGFNQFHKYKFSSQLPVGSGQKPLSHCVTAPLSWEPKNRRFKAVPEREGGIAKQ